MSQLIIGNIDYKHLATERKKAKTLKKTAWWKNQIGNGKCVYCKRSFHPRELTMEHKIPLVRGGRTTKKNVVPACLDCNQKKYNLSHLEWQER